MFNLTINKMKNRKKFKVSEPVQRDILYRVLVASQGVKRCYYYETYLDAINFVKGLSFSEYALVDLSIMLTSSVSMSVYEYNKDKCVSARPSKRRQR